MKTLLEVKLTPYQSDYRDDMKMEGEFYSDKLPADYHDEVFAKYNDGDKNAQRIVLPMGAKSLAVPNMQVLSHLAKHNITVHDYGNNIALEKIKTKQGEKIRPIKISKALEMTNAPEDLQKTFINDANRRKDKDVQLVISRHPDDIGGMSTGVGWVSCQTMPSYHGDPNVSEYHRCIVHDFRHGTLAAFVTRKGDDNVESPISRTLIKRFISPDKKHSVFRTTGNFYGSGNAALADVQHFAETNYPITNDEEYTLAPQLYPEGKKIFSKADNKESQSLYEAKIHMISKAHFFPDFHNLSGRASQLTINHNTDEKGALHSTDTTPAIHVTAPSGHTLTMHFHHGELHHDSEPSIIEKDPEGNITSYAHFKYGKLHSPQDGSPSVVTKRINEGKVKSLEMKWHKFGMLHSDLNSGVAIFSHKESEPGVFVTQLDKKVYDITPEEGVRRELYFNRANGADTHIIHGRFTSQDTGNVLTEVNHRYKEGKLSETVEMITHPKHGSLTHTYDHKFNIGTINDNGLYHTQSKVYYGPYVDVTNKFRDFHEEL